MQRLTDEAVEQLGGTTAVANLLKAPVSTVHSWKRNGISPSRLDHLKLAAKAAGKDIDWDAAIMPVVCGVCDRRADNPETRACVASNCGLRAKEAA